MAVLLQLNLEKFNGITMPETAKAMATGRGLALGSSVDRAITIMVIYRLTAPPLGISDAEIQFSRPAGRRR